MHFSSFIMESSTEWQLQKLLYEIYLPSAQKLLFPGKGQHNRALPSYQQQDYPWEMQDALVVDLSLRALLQYLQIILAIAFLTDMFLPKILSFPLFLWPSLEFRPAFLLDSATFPSGLFFLKGISANKFLTH